MDILHVWALSGLNVWGHSPVLEAAVDLKALADASSSTIPGFVDRLTRSLPSLADRHTHEQLRRGMNLARVLQLLTMELETLAGTPIRFGETRPAGSGRGCFLVAVEYEYEDLGRACLEVARDLCLAASHDHPVDVAAALQRLRDLEYRLRPGSGTRAILRAARARGLPVEQLGQPPGNLLQLGQGSRQRRVSNARTDRTGMIPQAIAQDKELTRRLLRESGIPVPQGRPVSDAEDAWQAAEQLGLPVVVKPRDQDNGMGVVLNCTTREQVLAGYSRARRESPNVLVERQAPGWHHRLLIVGDRVVAAARRDPAQVLADGTRTIAQLIERTNADPRRGPNGPLYEIRVDDTVHEVLAGQGYTLDSIPPAGVRVLVRRLSYIQEGGTVADVTDCIHPDVAARVIEATRVVGLDLAGVDVVAEDLSRPLEEQGGAVIEVNDTPALGQHLHPLCDPPRPIGEAVVDFLIPPGQTGRIPIVAVTGSSATVVAHLIADVLAASGSRVGLSCADGVYDDGRRVQAWDCTGPQAVRAVLRNPTVDAAVLEVSGEGILREGLGFDLCDVAVVTGFNPDAPGREDGSVLAERLTVAAVGSKGTAVLNADDPQAAALAEHCPGSVTWFARTGRHRDGVGRAASSRGEAMGPSHGKHDLIWPMPAPLAEAIADVLAVIAACRSLGLGLEAILKGLGLPAQR